MLSKQCSVECPSNHQRASMQSRLDSDINIVNIEKRIQAILKRLEEIKQADTHPVCHEGFGEIEKELSALTRELSDLYAAIRLQKALDSSKEQAKGLAKSIHKTLKNKGLRLVNICFLGGTKVSLVVTYYTRNCDERRKRENGYYPGLVLLGIYDGCTPELASEISMASAALCSLKEAQDMLENRGCYLDIKTIRNIMKRFSVRARAYQQSCDYALMMDSESKAKGRRIVASIDGGRLRIRKTKRGPKTKKKRSRYRTDWREPKLLIIYVVDENGRTDKRFLPIIDGSVSGGADYVFELLESYLKKLNIGSEDKLLFVADGALWIWERVKELKKKLALKDEQVYELLDFYHAVEHLNDLASLKTKWSATQRKKWVGKLRSCLKAGKIDECIDAVKAACAGTKNKLIVREREYFIKNRSRMEYAAMARLKFPMGSGAMESTIRRVVNQRLKSPGVFWLEETANEMILLRAYYKAGRWEHIKKMSLAHLYDQNFGRAICPIQYETKEAPTLLVRNFDSKGEQGKKTASTVILEAAA